jgi:outer membrane protein OmpA-like peptidoglycan-associated protein
MLIRPWLLTPLSALALCSLLCLPAAALAQDEDEDPPEASAKEEGGGGDADSAKDAKADADAPRQPDANPGLYAPTLNGPTGLFRLVTTDVGGPHTFRVGLHTELGVYSGFLVTGDEHNRFLGSLKINYTPIKFAEFFVAIQSAANNNTRDDPARKDQDVILALGDFSFGGKGQYPILPYLSVGGNLSVLFLNSVGGVSVDGDAIGFYVGMISSFDLDPLAGIPLRFHLNFGYRLDNSGDLANFESYHCDQCLASLQVEKFSLGIKPSRLQLRFGMDFPMRKWTGIGVTPIFELAADFATDDSDADFEHFASIGKLSDADMEGTTTMWLTIGARVNPLKGLNVELAVDVGTVDPGYGFGPPVLPWNLILGFSYSYDPAPPVKVVTKETVKTVVKTVAPQPTVGKLRGRVVNAKSLEPVEGAIVTFPGKDLTGLSTDPDGSFLTYEMPGGKHPVMVRHPDYLPGKVMAEIKIGAVSAQDVKLTPAPPKVGKLTGRVADLKGAPVAATIAVSGPETKELTTDGSGGFTAELKPGAYKLQVNAAGYLRKEKPVTIAAGGQFSVDITVSKRPRRSLVRVTKRNIHIRRKIHFATGTATIKPNSRQLLDAVVDVFLSNPSISTVEIGGHTDNRGRRAMNMQLSQSRADAVKDYLTQNGVDASRLMTKGYGSSKPKVPNITKRNRARNRRVEFKIRKQ